MANYRGYWSVAITDKTHQVVCDIAERYGIHKNKVIHHAVGMYAEHLDRMLGSVLPNKPLTADKETNDK